MYKDKADELNAKAAKEYEEAGGDAAADGADGDGDDGRRAPRSSAFPLARVKRIMKLDKEVKNMQVDASKCVAKCAELFIESLVEGSFRSMRANKRKTIKYGDVEHHVLRKQRLEFLHDHVWGVSAGGGAGRWGEGRKGRREGERRGRRRRRRGDDTRPRRRRRSAAGREAGYRFMAPRARRRKMRRQCLRGLSPSGARIRRAIRDETRATSTCHVMYAIYAIKSIRCLMYTAACREYPSRELVVTTHHSPGSSAVPLQPASSGVAPPPRPWCTRSRC